VAALTCARGNLDNEMPRLAIKMADGLLEILSRTPGEIDGTMEAHLIRGQSYLRMNKLKKASKAFETVVACYNNAVGEEESHVGESSPAFLLCKQGKAGLETCAKATAAAAASNATPTSSSAEFGQRRLQGKSVWNSKNTWEEVDMTDWAITKLQAFVEGLTFTPPSINDGSSSTVAHVKASKLQEVSGFCQIVNVQRKRKFLFDFNFDVQWEAKMASGKRYKGKYKFQNVSHDSIMPPLEEDSFDVEVPFGGAAAKLSTHGGTGECDELYSILKSKEEGLQPLIVVQAFGNMMKELKKVPDSGIIPSVEPPRCKVDLSKRALAVQEERARAESVQRLMSANPNCKVVL